ncbi:hypothetical protein AVEN_216369-1 [Araneus ventricosus]|uniref:Histone-lysine N-methyltransferase SETMAR n=1 Tax=Araneus ventricosus TaxID=182803 RepID=A0A4Y2V9C8_ARAVE|nr:hypothetical protein AVEN_190424-1 [Araneus ventricosus]GBO20333.1 hypothetical protein AVEN_216369-1 [Araneus ventricosus]
MLCDGVFLLRDDTHTARKTQELLQEFKWEVWSRPLYSQDLALNLGSKRLFVRKLSSNSDVKTAAENWLNGQGRDFYEARLNTLVLLLNKCINKFGDYFEN